MMFWHIKLYIKSQSKIMNYVRYNALDSKTKIMTFLKQ